MKKLSLGLFYLLLFVLLAAVAVIVFNLYGFTRPVEVVALSTPWTEKVDPDKPLPDYPRPQLRRDNWHNLNGRWHFAITALDAPTPEQFDREIVVPFPVESMLSGVQQPLLPEQRLWYQRTFSAPVLQPEQRLLLHFGAVDWEAEVWINGVSMGGHRGGYDPFSFDITDALVPEAEQEVIVAVHDPSNLGPGAYGKQHLVPHGIRYTAASGIWQTVWLEPVAASRVTRLVSTTDLGDQQVQLQINTHGAQAADTVAVSVFADDSLVAQVSGPIGGNLAEVTLAIPDLRPWSPDDPYLYDVAVRIERNGETLDAVEGYFGAREVSTAKDENGIARLFLNGHPVFHLGLLDQGWWPDGLYTAPTDAALAFDIEATKRLGFNSIRKHVKVEPARWYWHADRLGLLVWQDMPTGDGGAKRYQQILRQALDIVAAYSAGEPWRELVRPQASAVLFEAELAAMVRQLAAFPSVVSWVPFNEAWGQFNTDDVLAAVAQQDPSRLVDGPSGWFDTGVGDVFDLHMYEREEEFIAELPAGRAVVYGEFGGLGLPMPGHLAAGDGWGYAAFEQQQEYEDAYVKLMILLERLVPQGLAGAFYTQTTDVESEVNGLITYDRRVFKIPPARLARINQRLIRSMQIADE